MLGGEQTLGLGCSCLSPGLRTWGMAQGGGCGHKGEEVESETLNKRMF